MKRGFTLIETMIYVALFVIIIGGGFVGAYQVISSSDYANRQSVIDEEGNFVIRKIEWALSGTQTINSPALGVTGSTLSINKYNFAPNNPVVFDLNMGVVRLKKGSGSPISLTTSNVVVSNLSFTQIATSGIRASLTIQGKIFETTKYIRQ